MSKTCRTERRSYCCMGDQHGSKLGIPLERTRTHRATEMGAASGDVQVTEIHFEERFEDADSSLVKLACVGDILAALRTADGPESLSVTAASESGLGCDEGLGELRICLE
jgi:hypothetical protein